MRERIPATRFSGRLLLLVGRSPRPRHRGDDAHGEAVLFVNAPLRDYSLLPRTNDYTLPVLVVDTTTAAPSEAAARIADHVPAGAANLDPPTPAQLTE